MTITSYTAVILTFHHLSIALSVSLAILFSALIYWLFIRRHRYRIIAIGITFVISLILGMSLSQKLFQQQPLGIELVNAG